MNPVRPHSTFFGTLRVLATGLLLFSVPLSAKTDSEGLRKNLASIEQALESGLDCRYDDCFRSLANLYDRDPDSPLSDYYLRLLDSIRADLETPSLWTSFLERTAAKSELAALYLDAEYFRQGRAADCRALRTRLGVITNWLAMAPFDNEDGAGHAAASPPETSPFDPAAVYTGKLRPVRWRTIFANPYGRVKPDNWVRPYQEVTGYFCVFLRSETEQTGRLLLGIDTPFKIFLNGQPVVDNPDQHAFVPDQHAYSLTLRAGWNLLMLKSSQPDQEEWKFLVRLSGWSSPVVQSLSLPGPDNTGAPSAWVPVDETARTLEDLGPDAAFHAAYWSYLLQNTDAARNETGRKLERIALDHPSALHCFMAGISQSARRGSVNFLEAGLKNGDRDEILVQLIQDAASLEREPRKSELIARLKRTPRRLSNFLANEHLINGRTAEARSQLDRWTFEKDADWHFLSGLCSVLSPSCKGAESDFREALRLDRTIEGPRSRLVELLQASGRTADALALLEGIRELFPDSVELLCDISDILSRLNRTDEARSLLADAVAICPEDSYVLNRAGDTARIAGRIEEARAYHLRALDLNPGDRDLRQKIHSLYPATNALFQLDPDFVWPQVPASDGTTRILLKRELCEVFPDGTHADLVRRLVYIASEEDVERWSTEHVFYDPETERVDILRARVYDDRTGKTYREADRIFDQAYGGQDSSLFYDLRVRSVSFPRVTPGCVIEWRCLVTEQGRNTAAAGHFGKEVTVRESVPVDRSEFILLPASDTGWKSAEENLPRTLALRTDRRVVRGRTAVRWIATNLLPIAPEALAPPDSERAGSIIVSTLPDWTSFGIWLSDLYKDRMTADESVASEARALTEGLATDREKIESVWSFVSSSIRYTGLELGLGGIRPRKASEVLSSGFGDCKDKASLMAVLLREAGVPAQVALVRTAERGRSGFPLPLIGAFDHAVCYADGTIWDATAELFAPEALPWQNTFNRYFVLDGPSSRFLEPPAGESRANRSVGRCVVSFEPDGTAVLERAGLKMGQEAAYLRYEFISPERRDRRIEESWNASFPGARVESSSFTNLFPPRDPAALLYRIRLPGFVKQEDNRVWIPMLPVRGEFQALYAPDGSARTSDAVIPYPFEYEETVEYELPQEWEPDGLPPKLQEENRFGRFETESVFRNRTVTVRFRFVLNNGRITPDRHAAFRKWLSASDRAQNIRLYLKRTAP